MVPACFVNRKQVKDYMYLVVDKAPLLQESMDSDDGTHVSGQVTSASCHGEVFRRVETVGVDHKVAVFLVDCRRFVSVLLGKKLWE